MIFELAQDYSETLKAMPAAHPRWYIVRLIDEALRRDVHFIERHQGDYPQAIFQTLWNLCWWCGCQEGEVEGANSCGDKNGNVGNLSDLMENWRSERARSITSFRYWLRSGRPPARSLGGADRGSLVVGRFSAVAFSPDGALVACGGEDGKVSLWKRPTDNELPSPGTLSGGIISLAFHPDGLDIACAGRDGAIWVFRTFRDSEARVFEGHTSQVTTVYFTRCGRYLLSGSLDGSVRVWTFVDGQLFHSIIFSNDQVSCLSAAVSASRLAIGTKGGDVRVVDSQTWLEIHYFRCRRGAIEEVDISPGGDFVVAGTSEGRVVVWDLMTAESREMSTTSYHAVNSVQFAPDGKSVVVSFHDGRILLWNYLNNSVSSIFQMPSESWSVMIRFAPKGDEIASVCDGVYPKDWMVRLLSIFGNASPAVRDDHARGIGDIVFSPDGTMIATVSSDWTVRMWETSPARLRASLDGHEDEVTEAGFSPDGTKLASRSDDDTVRLWDAKSGECLRILSGTESHVSIKQHIPCKKPLSVTRDHREMSIWAGDISALIAYDACVYHLTDVHPHKHIYCGAHGAELEIMHLEEK